LLRSLPDAKLLAGGHSLLPMMKLRLTSPAHLIDLGRIKDLRYIKESGSAVAIGALTTHWTIESSPLVQQKLPSLAECARSIGDVQVRNVGTIGGSLAHTDPAADYPAAILALNADLVAEGPRGRRTIASGEFFTGLFSTALRPDEILVEVKMPVLPPRTGSAYLKFPHPASGFAVVGVAAVLTLDSKGRCEQARIGITGVGPFAYRPQRTEDALRGVALDDKTIAAAADKAGDGVAINEDIFASADYRRHLAQVFTRRAIKAALQRAR
ncbi:MAG: xanthine dehydrogenase family protein subunit M, partial [Armatimonadetes bacterium]|nr:xanthine dehydrogenase family protein subunit M [Armatimonadota bacterium]